MRMYISAVNSNEVAVTILRLYVPIADAGRSI